MTLPRENCEVFTTTAYECGQDAIIAKWSQACKHLFSSSLISPNVGPAMFYI